MFGQWNYNLRPGAAVAGDVAREPADLRHQDNPVFPGRRAAYPPAEGDFHAGRPALEGTQDQLVPLGQIKADPVDVRQGHGQQGRGVGQIGHRVAGPLGQGGQLLGQQGI